jgi:hypothetical protein
VIGTTTVARTATDAAGNASSKSFTVTVRSAAQQVGVLTTTLSSMTFTTAGVASSLGAHLDAAQKKLPGDVAGACTKLETFLDEVAKKTPKQIDATQAAILTGAATQIKIASGC